MTQRYHKLGALATWGLPALIVPALRLTQDPPETRWKLFTRDFSTYALGAGLFLLFEGLASRMLKKRVPNLSARNFYSICAGVTANILFAGLGAPRLYRVLEMLFPKLKTPSTPTVPTRRPQKGFPSVYQAPGIQPSPVVRSAPNPKMGGRQYGFERFA